MYIQLLIVYLPARMYWSSMQFTDQYFYNIYLPFNFIDDHLLYYKNYLNLITCIHTHYKYQFDNRITMGKNYIFDL